MGIPQAFDADGRRLVSVSRDRTVRVWSVPDGALLGTPRGHAALVARVWFAPDSRHVICASRDGTVNEWLVTEHGTMPTMRCHRDAVCVVAFGAGDFELPCALIIGERKASTDTKTSLNETLREFALG